MDSTFKLKSFKLFKLLPLCSAAVFGRGSQRRDQLERFPGLLPESQGHNQALTVLYVPYSLDRDAPPQPRQCRSRGAERGHAREDTLQRFRGGLVSKAHRLCVSLNSRLESNQEEGDTLCTNGDMGGCGESARTYELARDERLPGKGNSEGKQNIQGYLAHKKQPPPLGPP